MVRLDRLRLNDETNARTVTFLHQDTPGFMLLDSVRRRRLFTLIPPFALLFRSEKLDCLLRFALALCSQC